jgi:putative endonuclease
VKSEWVEIQRSSPSSPSNAWWNGAGALALVKPLPSKAAAGRSGFTRAIRPRLQSPPADDELRFEAMPRAPSAWAGTASPTRHCLTSYFVYLLASRRHGTLYLGITNDLVRRVHQHEARSVPDFTAQYTVDSLVWFETHDDPTNAIAREKAVKIWRRDAKIRLIEEQHPEWRDFYATLTR